MALGVYPNPNAKENEQSSNLFTTELLNLPGMLCAGVKPKARTVESWRLNQR